MKIVGLNKVINDLKQFGKDAEGMIEDELLVTSLSIVENAKLKVPVDNGSLRNSIYNKALNPLRVEIGVGASYGAYVEFGTGKYVSVPTELNDIASKFKGKKGGTFEEGLRAIKDWCRTKGIEEKYAYPIFMSILRTGLRPRPYFYPAYKKGTLDLVKNLNIKLKKLKEKYG